MASDNAPLPPEARGLLRVLASNAPLDALVTLRSMGSDGESLIPHLYSAVAERDMAAAQSLLAEEESRGLQRSSSAFGERAAVLGAIWARTGPEAAFHWGLTLPPYQLSWDCHLDLMGNHTGVSVRDFHATILHALGLEHELLSFRFQGLDQRLTGVEHARVVKEIFA